MSKQAKHATVGHECYFKADRDYGVMKPRAVMFWQATEVDMAHDEALKLAELIADLEALGMTPVDVADCLDTRETMARDERFAKHHHLTCYDVTEEDGECFCSDLD